MATSARAAAGDLRARAAPDRSIDDLDIAIRRLARRMNSESYELLMLVREFDDRLGWQRWSCKSCAEWLAWRCALSISTAREHVRVAQALRELPAISAAFAAGSLSYSKVRALTRAAHLHDEALLLAHALQATAAQVEERCRQIRNVAPASVEDARRAWARRSLSVWRDAARNTVKITVELPTEDGELVLSALEKAVASREVASEPELGETSWLAQQADALVTVAAAYLARPCDEPASAADRYQVVFHVDGAALRGGAGRSDLPIETIRRLTCDGSIVTIVDDGDGKALGVGRKKRTVSPALKRALWARDRGCTFPGCTRKLYVDAHHVEHWADGGATDAANLTLLCTYHHRLLHEGGFEIRRDADGAFYFRRPDGRAIPRCGYRVDDIVDDGVDMPSADAWVASAVKGGQHHNAEVRETRAGYWLSPRFGPSTMCTAGSGDFARVR